MRFTLSIYFVFATFIVFSQTQIIHPYDSQIYANDILDIVWEPNDITGNYSIQIATDKDFINIVKDTSNIFSNHCSFVLANDKYFTRIKKQNTNWLDTVSFLYTNINTSKIVRWFDASYDLILDSINILAYKDKKTNLFVQQNDSTKQPVLDTSIFVNNQRVARFDGINDNFIIQDSTDVSQIIAVCNYNSQDSTFSNYKGIINSATVNTKPYMLTVNKLDNRFYKGTAAFFGNNIEVNQTDFGNLFPFKEFKLINGFCSEKEKFEKLKIGGALNYQQMSWDGDIAEIIVFDSILTQEETSQFYKYLRNKYSPAVNLGYDIYPYGFCETTITTAQKPWFKSYLWSTGDTTETLSVNQSGTYAVSVTDIFGFSSSDTIKVTFPQPLTLSDSTICLGDTINWDTGLDQDLYNFSWSNSFSSGSNNSFFTETDMFVTITDSLGCTYKSDSLHLSLDTYPKTNLLKDNDTLCSGSNFYLSNDSLEILSYQWSNGSLEESITIEDSGIYTVTATNSLGCIAKDSIDIYINGRAPKIGFTTENLCLMDVAIFNDTSFVTDGSNIIDWSWHFQGEQISTIPNPTFVFDSIGTKTISLTVTTDSGCVNTLKKELQIYPNPTANFEVDYGVNQCAGQKINLTNFSNPDSIITQYFWLKENLEFSTNKDISITLNNPGKYSIGLIANTAFTCSDTVFKTINVSDELNVPDPTSLVCPLNNTTIYDNENIMFQWNLVEFSYYYVFDLSFDQDFNTIIFSSQTENNYITYPITELGTYYWRICSYNLCGDSSISASNTFKYETLNDSKIVRWFDASYDLILDSINILAYKDKKTNLFVQQNDSTKQPVLDTSIFVNNQRVARFDGINDNFIIQDSTDVSQIIAVCNYNSQDSTFSNYKGIINSATVNTKPYMLTVNKLDNRFYKGTAAFFGNNIKVNQTDFGNLFPFKEFKLINGFCSEKEKFEKLKIGGALNYQQMSWDGDIAEIIVFDSILTQEETSQFYKYLRNKYSPAVNLGYDIYPYGFCETTITTAQKPWFKSYLWSTGDTTKTLSVNQSGTYAVSVTDIFGFSSSDTIKVTFPGNLKLIDTSTICYGDTLFWNTKLNDNYTFEWQDGSTEPFYNISTTGSYSVTISDTLGCLFKTDTTHVFVDMLPVTNFLNDKDTLCSGMILSLLNHTTGNISYQWSNGNTSKEFVVLNSDKFWVTISNDLGCVGTDSTDIYIKGIAPNVGFTTENTCFSDLTLFTDTSTSDQQSNIIEWEWDFGDGMIRTEQNPSFTFNDTGNHIVNLKIVTDSACENKIKKTVRIYSLPKAKFKINSPPCQENLIMFINQSTPLMGSIENSIWEFDDGNNLSGTSVEKSFSNFGNQNIKLTVKTSYGCINSIDSTIHIKPSPKADFTYTAACANNNIHFEDASNIENNFGIASWNWKTDDNQESYEDAPVFNFPTSGKRLVHLKILAINGCKDSTSKYITINPTPTAMYVLRETCQNTPLDILNISSDPVTEINTYYWFLDNNLVSVDSKPYIFLEDTNYHYLFLKVISKSLCTDTIGKRFKINPKPIATFTVNENYTTPRIPIHIVADYINESYNYSFALGDGGVSSASDLNYSYMHEGEYTVSLLVKNQWSCQDSSAQNINIVRPLMDLLISNVKLIKNKGKYQFQAEISNIGNLDAHGINFRFIINNKHVFEEISQTNLLIEETKIITLNTQLLNKPEYFCINIKPEGIYQDVYLDNNAICINNVESKNVASIYPNPVNAEYTLLYYAKEKRSVKVEIYNLYGQLISKIDIPLDKGLNRYVISSKDLVKGQYLFKIDDQVIKLFKD